MATARCDRCGATMQVSQQQKLLLKATGGQKHVGSAKKGPCGGRFK